MNVLSERASGILLHPTSLPGPFGTGDLGPAARRFIEFLALAGQRWWQMLPVGPIGGVASPYDSPSSFAGNPLLISLEDLRAQGYLETAELAVHPRLARAPLAQYGASRRFRTSRLQRAFERFEAHAPPTEHTSLLEFAQRNAHWLPDFCLFQALREHHRGLPWTHWAEGLRRRHPTELQQARARFAREVRYQEFLQYIFAQQWTALQKHAQERGIKLLGDIPMFVAHDGADVWSNPQCFLLNEHGMQRAVAGVPPDYFNAEGQRWGNPLYDWEELKRTGYNWWILRLRSALDRFDAVRLDHFIGFHHYWAIPAHSESARVGEFLRAPGYELFGHVQRALGDLPFIAEDLGLLTPEVRKLRDDLGLPGMRVLQFGFGEAANEYQPHRYTEKSVVYTGTHDTDTLVGWLNAHTHAATSELATQLSLERARALAYAGSNGVEAHWDLIRITLMSVPKLALFPIQDILGLGSHARMNLPGTVQNNWRYRLSEGELSVALAQRLRELCERYERVPTALPVPTR